MNQTSQYIPGLLQRKSDNISQTVRYQLRTYKDNRIEYGEPTPTEEEVPPNDNDEPGWPWWPWWWLFNPPDPIIDDPISPDPPDPPSNPTPGWFFPPNPPPDSSDYPPHSGYPPDHPSGSSSSSSTGNRRQSPQFLTNLAKKMLEYKKGF